MSSPIFSENGPLATSLRALGRNVHIRKAQALYGDKVSFAIKSHKPAFLDAETGVGKTLGYLAPMATEAFANKAERPLIVVSTATVALQKQITKDDMPVIAELVKATYGFEPKIELRVGREQIVDPTRLEIAIDEMAGPEDELLARKALAWVEEKISADELPFRSDLIEHFSSEINGGKPWLLQNVIGLEDESGAVGKLYEKLLIRCMAADILVINHHLLALNMLRGFLWDEERPIYLVVDEADRLPSVVESVNRLTLPLHNLKRIAGGFKELEKAIEPLNELENEVLLHFSDAWKGAQGSVTQTNKMDDGEKALLLQRMSTAEKLLEVGLRQIGLGTGAKDREKIRILEDYQEQLRGLRKEMEVSGTLVLYYSPVRLFPGIASVRSGSSRMIASRLWNKTKFNMRALVFTSATLATMSSQGGSEDAKRAVTPFISQCGFDIATVDQAMCALIAPENFGEMSFVRPSLDATSPFMEDAEDPEAVKLRPEAVELWADMIRTAAEDGGRTLVLVPSHRDVKALAELLADIEERLVVQVTGMPTNAAVRKFLNQSDTVWISASAWEGVSLPGAISHIVIPRLPIRPSSLEDNIIEQYFDEMNKAAKGRSFVFARKLADTRRKLRQGIGRGIRSADDKVKIWIGDGRWPLSQLEIDQEFRDQPTTWSTTLLNAIPKRFRKKLEKSPRFS